MKRPRFSRPISCCLSTVATILIVGGGCAILLDPGGESREKARDTNCLSNVKQMAIGLIMYAQDYDDQLPAAAEWMDATLPYGKDDAVYHCPSVSRGNASIYGYACSNRLSRKKLIDVAAPAWTPTLYDSNNLDRNACDPFAKSSNPPRHDGRNNVGFLDGHAKPLTPQEIDKAVRNVGK